MTTKPETFLSNLLRKRAVYRPGKTRKQRQQQWNQQTLMLIVVVVGTIIAGGAWMAINWNGAGVANPADCENYPEYCVPFAGGGEFNSNEAEGVRVLDADSSGADGVVRGIWPDTNRPFIGNPDAPLHVWIVADFACTHCQDYHEQDFDLFLENYVLTGQATVEYSSYDSVGGAAGLRAMQAALCAGEQGALWEYSDEMYRLAQTMSPARAFSTSRLNQAAEDMGLDEDNLRSCLNSNRYRAWVSAYTSQAVLSGVTGTPNVFVRYGTAEEWQRVNGAYAELAGLTQRANGAN